MIAHKNWIINLTMSSLIAVTCVVGDGKLQAIAGPLKRAIVDNSTHGLIGFFSALIVLIDQLDGETEKLYLAVVCMMMSSLIDIDHFIAAKSVKLADATSLQSRPFLHNSSIPLLLISLLIYCHLTTKSESLVIWLIISIVAFVTHHLRDANRRGLWFAPFGSTRAINDPIYILLILATPYMLKFFVPITVKYTRVKSTVIDV